MKELNQLRTQIRLNLLKTFQTIGYGHIGGSLSIVDLLTVLYGKVMNVNAQQPQWYERDRLVLSKGHAGPALYATLAQLKFFPKSWLATLNEGGTLLPSHPNRNKTPGVDATTGSLGQGISIAAGMSLGFRKQQLPIYTYVIVGDGELNEGQCWEAFQFIAHHQLNRCIVIIDDNKKQLDGLTQCVLNPYNLQQKMEAFGFYTLKVKGSDMLAINDAIDELKQQSTAVCLILDTIKGQGIPYFEHLENNHSVKFDNDELKYELSKAIEQLEQELITYE